MYWKGQNGEAFASIKLDLEAEFWLDSIVLEFEHSSDKPKAMIIEKSKDYGKTWKPLQYFADNCESSFPGITVLEERKTNEIGIPFCRTNDETEKRIQFKLLPEDAIIDERKYFLSRVTTIRVNMTELRDMATPAHKIVNMNVAGSCLCNGHASNCVPTGPDDVHVPGKVHAKCECRHNTKGLNCEECDDLFNDKPWVPGFVDNPSCQRCECNERATDCFFDENVFKESNNSSGGVCVGCRYSTGKHCERCKSFFYLDPTENSCNPCNCDPLGSLTRLCDNLTGQCDCKPGQTGRTCGLEKQTSPP